MCSASSDRFTGGCLCGAVRFSGIWGDDPPTACHCNQCRKWSGHVWASGPATDLTIDDDSALRWYASSDHARRGFCATCGSSLFWHELTEPYFSVSLAAIDEPTGLRLDHHIWVDFKGDYYDIADGLPQTTSAQS